MCGLHGPVLQILKDSSTNSNISNNKKLALFLHFLLQYWKFRKSPKKKMYLNKYKNNDLGVKYNLVIYDILFINIKYDSFSTIILKYF